MLFHVLCLYIYVCVCVCFMFCVCMFFFFVLSCALGIFSLFLSFPALYCVVVFLFSLVPRLVSWRYRWVAISSESRCEEPGLLHVYNGHLLSGVNGIVRYPLLRFANLLFWSNCIVCSLVACVT